MYFLQGTFSVRVIIIVLRKIIPMFVFKTQPVNNGLSLAFLILPVRMMSRLAEN